MKLIKTSYLFNYCYPKDYWDCNDDFDPLFRCKLCIAGHSTRKRPREQWQGLDHPNDPGYKELLQHIDEHGVKNPIVLEINNHNIVKDGHHRILAALTHNIQWVPYRLSNTIIDYSKELPAKSVAENSKKACRVKVYTSPEY